MNEKKSSVSEDNNKYETMIIFEPNLGEEATLKKVQEVKDIIAESEGEVWHEDAWGIRELAYKIAGNDKGFYVVLNFNLPPNKIKKLDKYLKLEKSCVRHMIITIPDNYEVKTLEEYKALEEKEKAALQNEAARQETEEDKKGTMKPVKRTGRKETVGIKPDGRKIKKTDKKEEPLKRDSEEKPIEKMTGEEPKIEEVKEKKEPLKDKKSELDDLDAKLQSIINDPDIIL